MAATARLSLLQYPDPLENAFEILLREELDLDPALPASHLYPARGCEPLLKPGLEILDNRRASARTRAPPLATSPPPHKLLKLPDGEASLCDRPCDDGLLQRGVHAENRSRMAGR
jgi:hypothetical protein